MPLVDGLFLLSLKLFSHLFVLRSNANGVRTQAKAIGELAHLSVGEVHFRKEMHLLYNASALSGRAFKTLGTTHCRRQCISRGEMMFAPLYIERV